MVNDHIVNKKVRSLKNSLFAASPQLEYWNTGMIGYQEGKIYSFRF